MDILAPWKHRCIAAGVISRFSKTRVLGPSDTRRARLWVLTLVARGSIVSRGAVARERVHSVDTRPQVQTRVRHAVVDICENQSHVTRSCLCSSLFLAKAAGRLQGLVPSFYVSTLKAFCRMQQRVVRIPSLLFCVMRSPPVWKFVCSGTRGTTVRTGVAMGSCVPRYA